jgi:hypothetical protein
MNWKRYGRKRSWPNLRYYSDIFLEGIRKISEVSRPPGRDMNPGHFEYKAGVFSSYYSLPFEQNCRGNLIKLFMKKVFLV